MDVPMKLNEEIQYKMDNVPTATMKKVSTLDQTVIETIKRDFENISNKIKTTLSGEGDYEKLRKEWDLWGPLIISLVTASLTTFGTKADSEQVFTTIFVGLWIGPLMITLNSRLLGAKIPIIQSLCLIIYCTSPIMMLSVVVFIMNFIISSFFINLALSIGALVFTLRCNYVYFESLVKGQKSLLNLYPVLLFYTFICLFIAMT